RARRRVESPPAAIDGGRASAPDDDRLGRGQLGRVDRALFGLRLRRQAPATSQRRQRLYDRSRANRSEFVVETARSLACGDRNGMARNDRTGVQAFVHPYEGDAGFAVTREQGA